jgi:hypothetical protein
MSYARFRYDSGVYVFFNNEGMYECCDCSLTEKGGRHAFECATAVGMVEHLIGHAAAGGKVRKSTIEALQRETAPGANG